MRDSPPLLRQWLAATLAAGMLALPLPAAAQVSALPEVTGTGTATGDAAAQDDRDDGRRTLGNFPANLLRGAGGVFARESIGPLLIGAAATGAGALLDDEVRDAIADEDDDLADFADDYLGPAGLGVVTLGLFIGGRYSEDTRFRAMSYDLGVAAVVNLGYTGVLKAAVSRERPNESGDDSFPSGHTSNAFALASVADAHYGRKVGIPAYLCASLVGVSRLRSNAHWLSDVLAGAVLGHIVGRAVVRRNDGPARSGDMKAGRTTITPILGSRFRGLSVAVVF